MTFKGVVPSNGLLKYLRSTISATGTSSGLHIYSTNCLRRQCEIDDRGGSKRHGSTAGTSSTNTISGTNNPSTNNVNTSPSSDISKYPESDFISIEDNPSRNRRDSLAFLIGDDPPTGSIPNEQPMSSPSSIVTKSSNIRTQNKLQSNCAINVANTTVIDLKHTKINREIKTITINHILPFNQDWILKCKSLIKSHKWEHLEGVLKKGIKQQYLFDIRTLEIIMNKLLYHNQFKLVLRIFRNYESTCSQDRRCISAAVKAAMRSGDYELCEEIFEKYFDRLQDDLKTLETVLSNFIADSNLTVAKAFLYQIWPKAEDYTIKIFMNGAINVAHNANDLKEVFDKWRQGKYYLNSTANPLIYTVALEGFWKLGCKEHFDSVYESAVKDGLKNNSLLEQSLAKIALCEGDFELFRKIVARLNGNETEEIIDNANLVTPLSSLSLSKGNCDNKNPDYDLYHENKSHDNIKSCAKRALRRSMFSSAIAYHAKRGDIANMELVIKEMIDHGYQIKQDTIYSVIDGLYEMDEFPLLEYLQNCQSLGLMTSDYYTQEETASSTLEHIFKALVLKYPQLRQEILTKFKANRLSLPDGFGKKITHLSMKKQNRPLKTVYVPKFLVEKPNNSMHALRRIQDHNLSKTPKKGIKILEDLARRGIIPNRKLFMTVLRGLAKEEERSQTDGDLRNEIEFVLNMMYKMGHSPDAEVDSLVIQLELIHIKKDKLSSFNDKKARALSVIRNFYNDKNQKLTLKARTMLGYHLLYWDESYRAIGLFDSLRDGGKFTVQNHDNDSLTGMIKGYRKAGDFRGIIGVMNQFLSDKADIILYKQFLLELRLCHESALGMEGTIPVELALIREKCEEHNRRQSENAKKMVDEATKLFSLKGNTK